MYFTTQPPIHKPWIQRFIDQPHQLFFVSTIFFAFYTMIGTFLSLIGKEVDFGILHTFGLLFAVFTNAFLGFLITVIPKYTASQIIEKPTYLFIWGLYQIAIFLVLFGFVFIGKVLLIAVLLYVVTIFFKTIKKGTSYDKQESYLLTFLLFATVFMLLAEIITQKDFSILIFYGYLLNIVFLVALKMIPNFYSIYTKRTKWQKPKYILELSILLLFCMGLTSQFELLLFGKFVALFALVFSGYIIFKLDIYTKTPPIISILVASFLWFYLGVVIYFLEVFFELYTMKLSLHIFALGFILNLLIGFGSRVTMGHAIPAQQIIADKFTIGLFILLQVVILSRVLASVFYFLQTSFFMGFFHLSSTLWILLFLGWSLRYGKTLLRI